jgi:hypothetical protein
MVLRKKGESKFSPLEKVDGVGHRGANRHN